MADEAFPSIFPLEISPSDFYTQVIRCAIYLDACKAKASHLRNNTKASSPTALAFKKNYLKLLKLLLTYLADQLGKSEPKRYIRDALQGSLPSIKRDFSKVNDFLKTLPLKNNAPQIESVETLVILFHLINQRAQQPKREVEPRLSAPLNSDAIIFVEILCLILRVEFPKNPACSEMINQLESCKSNACSGAPTVENHTAVYVRRLFSWTTEEFTSQIGEMQALCDTQSYFYDVKKCLVHLELNQTPYLSGTDNSSPAEHAILRAAEQTFLDETLAQMILEYPELQILSFENELDSPSEYCIRPFVFVPNNPYDAYRALVMLTVRNELIRQKLPSISPIAHDLLGDCVSKWRIPGSLCVLASLEAVAFFYFGGKLAFSFLRESVGQVQTHLHQNPCQHWPSRHRDHLLALFQYLAHRILESLVGGVAKLSASTADGFLEALNCIFACDLFRAAHKEDLGSILAQLNAVLGQPTKGMFKLGNSEFLQLQLAAILVQRDIRFLTRHFPQPNLDGIDIPKAAADHLLLPFLHNLDGFLFAHENLPIPVEECLTLHSTFVKLFRLGRKFSPNLAMPGGLAGWFKMHFSKWLAALDGLALGWVERAIKLDTFEVSSSRHHSSSVDDLICSFQDQLDFLETLTWPSMLAEAQSMTKVTQVIFESIQLYVTHLKQLSTPRLSSSLDRIKWKLTSGGKTPRYAVVNNIHRLWTISQELFKSLNYPHLVHLAQAGQSDAKVFSITVRSGELIKEEEKGVYVVLATSGRKLLTTSAQRKAARLEWNESVTVTISAGQDISIRAYSNGKVCGQGFIHNCPHASWGAHDTDLWVNLMPQGRILLTTTSQEEADDFQFYTAKSLHLLEQTEDELLHQLASTAMVSGLAARDTRGFPGNDPASHSCFTDEECDDALAPLVDFLDAELRMPFSHLYLECGSKLVALVWVECLSCILNQLVPPFSKDRLTPAPLRWIEINFYMRAVELLKRFFHGGEDGDGLPMRMLENPDYRLVREMYELYFLATEDLIEEYMCIYRKCVASPPKAHSPDVARADLLLRLIGMRNERTAINFVDIQLEIKSKLSDWGSDGPKPIKSM